MNTNQRIVRRELADQLRQRRFIHVLNGTHAVEEVTVFAPLITERTTKIAGLGGNELHHSRGGQLESLRTNRVLIQLSPDTLATTVARVHASEVQIVCEVIGHCRILFFVLCSLYS